MLLWMFLQIFPGSTWAKPAGFSSLLPSEPPVSHFKSNYGVQNLSKRFEMWHKWFSKRHMDHQHHFSPFVLQDCKKDLLLYCFKDWKKLGHCSLRHDMILNWCHLPHVLKYQQQFQSTLDVLIHFRSSQHLLRGGGKKLQAVQVIPK